MEQVGCPKFVARGDLFPDEECSTLSLMDLSHDLSTLKMSSKSIHKQANKTDMTLLYYIRWRRTNNDEGKIVSDAFCNLGNRWDHSVTQTRRYFVKI